MRYFLIALLCGSAVAASFDELSKSPEGLTENQKIVYMAASEFLEHDTERAAVWLKKWNDMLDQRVKESDSYDAGKFVVDRGTDHLAGAAEKFRKDGAKAVFTLDEKREAARLVLFSVLRNVSWPEKVTEFLSDKKNADALATILSVKEVAKK